MKLAVLPALLHHSFSDLWHRVPGVVNTPLEAMEIVQYPTSETPTNIGIRCFLWGAVCLNQNTLTVGVCGKQEMALHINCKELLAAWLGLQCYAEKYTCSSQNRQYSGCSGHINKMGWVHLCSLALEVWDCCLCRDLIITYPVQWTNLQTTNPE